MKKIIFYHEGIKCLNTAFVNDYSIGKEKILEFWDNNSQTKNNIYFKDIKINELFLINTIKNITINYSADKHYFYIKTPKINKISKKLKNKPIKGILLDKNKYACRIDKNYINEIIYSTIEINGKIIKSEEIKLEKKNN